MPRLKAALIGTTVLMDVTMVGALHIFGLNEVVQQLANPATERDSWTMVGMLIFVFFTITYFLNPWAE